MQSDKIVDFVKRFNGSDRMRGRLVMDIEAMSLHEIIELGKYLATLPEAPQIKAHMVMTFTNLYWVSGISTSAGLPQRLIKVARILDELGYKKVWRLLAYRCEHLEQELSGFESTPVNLYPKENLLAKMIQYCHFVENPEIVFDNETVCEYYQNWREQLAPYRPFAEFVIPDFYKTYCHVGYPSTMEIDEFGIGKIMEE